MRLVQTEPSAVFIEFVGRKQMPRISQVLTRFYGPPGRFMWPAAEKAIPDVIDELKKRVFKATRDVQDAL
jgi:hypothetical protein